MIMTIILDTNPDFLTTGKVFLPPRKCFSISQEEFMKGIEALETLSYGGSDNPLCELIHIGRCNYPQRKEIYPGWVRKYRNSRCVLVLKLHVGPNKDVAKDIFAIKEFVINNTPGYVSKEYYLGGDMKFMKDLEFPEIY